MTREDILQALRLTAMGRAGHPLQEELAENLARVFASALPVKVADEPVVTEAVVAEAKRRKKAD